MSMPFAKGRSLRRRRRFRLLYNDQLEIGRGSTLSFGKYSGLTVKEILDIDPSYIEWMNDALDGILITQDLLDEAIRESRRKRLMELKRKFFRV